MRTGRGTLRRFMGQGPEHTMVGIEREVTTPKGMFDIQPDPHPQAFYAAPTAFLMLAPEVAQAILKQYGVESTPGFTSVEGIIGCPVEYTESDMGLIVKLEVKTN